MAADDNSINDNGSGDVQVEPPVESKGEPMSPPVRHKMESSLGADLSDVRVHLGHEATLLGATAYSTGSKIFFAPGQYQPHETAGEQLLAHELAHVIQQTNSRVSSLAPGLVRKP